MFKITILTLILASVLSMKLKLQVEYGQERCLYELLGGHQKYAFTTQSYNEGFYKMQIRRKTTDGYWDAVHSQESTKDLQRITVHRLAAHESTYAFCVKNPNRHSLNMSVIIQSGLQLLQFQILPNLSDAENFQRQLHWLQTEQMKFFQNLDKILALRATSQQIINMMPTKMIAFAIIGVLSIIVTNILFFSHLKKSLKDRKFI